MRVRVRHKIRPSESNMGCVRQAFSSVLVEQILNLTQEELMVMMDTMMELLKYLKLKQGRDETLDSDDEKELHKLEKLV